MDLSPRQLEVSPTIPFFSVFSDVAQESVVAINLRAILEGMRIEVTVDGYESGCCN
jgi:hypothetical protein